MRASVTGASGQGSYETLATCEGFPVPTSPVSRPGTVASLSIARMDHTNMMNTGRLIRGVAISPSGCALLKRRNGDDTMNDQISVPNSGVYGSKLRILTTQEFCGSRGRSGCPFPSHFVQVYRTTGAILYY